MFHPRERPPCSRVVLIDVSLPGEKAERTVKGRVVSIVPAFGPYALLAPWEPPMPFPRPPPSEALCATEWKAKRLASIRSARVSGHSSTHSALYGTRGALRESGWAGRQGERGRTDLIAPRPANGVSVAVPVCACADGTALPKL